MSGCQCMSGCQRMGCCSCTSGRISYHRLPDLLLALFVLAGAALSVPVQAATELQLLEQVRQQMPALEQVAGRFTQRKYLAVLPQPLVSKGQFRFDRAQGLDWQISEPLASRLVFDHDGLKQLQNGETLWQVSGDQPVVAMIGQVISAVLSADWTTLARYFEISGQLASGQWQLSLTPKDNAMAQMLTRIDLAGRQYLQTMTLFEANQDRTELSFEIASPSQ